MEDDPVVSFLPASLKGVEDLFRLTAMVALDKAYLTKDINLLEAYQSQTANLALRLSNLRFQMNYAGGKSPTGVTSEAKSIAFKLKADYQTIRQIQQRIERTVAHGDATQKKAIEAAIVALLNVFLQSFGEIFKLANIAAQPSHPNQTLMGLKNQRELLVIEIEDLSARIRDNNPVSDGATTLERLSQSTNFSLQGRKTDPYFSIGVP